MLSSLFKGKSEPPIRLVAALNGVDKIGPGNWDERLNAPSREQEASIRRRCEDIAAKLSSTTGLDPDQIEYYSALKRYRLIDLLSAAIRAATAGFKLDAIHPRDPFELAEPDVRAFAEQERARRAAARKVAATPLDDLQEQLEKSLSADKAAKLKAALRTEQSRPPKIAFLGKAGVGKTTTINNLFNAQWKTSHTVVGTTKAQAKEFSLPTGGSLTAVDLPGYGRSVKEDGEYEAIYREVLPDCDLVLLVLQADTRDMSDDEEMITKLLGWLKTVPRRS